MGGTKSNHHQAEEESKDGTRFPGCRGGGPKRWELIFPKHQTSPQQDRASRHQASVCREGDEAILSAPKGGPVLGPKKREDESSGK